MYTSQKNITRFHNLGYSYFLDPKELKEICSKFKKNEYMIYRPYPDSEKNMIYHKTVPEVSLYEIHTSLPLRHQDILGALYSLNIAPDLFGDIVITEGHYYLFLLPIVENYVEVQLTKIRDVNVELEKVDLSLLEDYHRNYETIELIVSSCRIDTILSSILHTARSNIIDSIKKKEILFNYEILTKLDLKVKEGDIFSIRKVGKFRFEKVIKRTKQDHYIIEVSKYV